MARILIVITSTLIGFATATIIICNKLMAASISDYPCGSEINAAAQRASEAIGSGAYWQLQTTGTLVAFGIGCLIVRLFLPFKNQQV